MGLDILESNGNMHLKQISGLKSKIPHFDCPEGNISKIWPSSLGPVGGTQSSKPGHHPHAWFINEITYKQYEDLCHCTISVFCQHLMTSSFKIMN